MNNDTEPNGCKCIEIIKANLEKHHGHAVELELKPMILVDDEATDYSFTQGLPPLYYTHKDGKKKKRSHVIFNFCPFCGRKQR